MSDTDDTGASGNGDYSLDPDDQLQPEDTLIDRGVDDILDEGISPPERPLGLDAHGLTGSEESAGETLDERLAEEEPDPYASLGDPLKDPADADEFEREEEFPNGDEVGNRRVGRLVAEDEGRYEDEESELIAGDVGIDGGAASAEEAAMHLIDDSED
ncbi:DUF5709 domain-containing protein [Rhodococcus sp. NPDC056506]|uniref:DUF5709 domain-containing protein n=1 Tax=Rhodococcus sp. NPDC056506 TaxID=3345844 RepID=UPI00367190B5